MGLGRIVAANKEKIGLVGLIQKSLTGPDKKKMPMKPDDFVRISSLAELCPREEVLCTKLDVTRIERPDPDRAITFALGRSIHDLFQNELLPPTGAFYGAWKCHRCDAIHGLPVGDQNLLDTIIRKPSECKCGGKSFRFFEPEMEDLTLRINGHPDGFLKMAGYDGFGVFEGKSIALRGFKEVAHSPQFSHVVQANLYMWLSKAKWAQILYWNKAGYGLNVFKEHFVEYDQDLVNSVRDVVISLRLGMVSNTLPKGVCENKSSSRALGCAVAGQCFAEVSNGDS